MELCFYFALAYALLIMDDVIANERDLFPSFSKLMFQEDSSKVESMVSSKINDGIDEIWNLMFRLCEGQAEEDIAEYFESAMKKVKVKHDGKLSSTNCSHSVNRWAVQHIQDKLPSHMCSLVVAVGW